MSCRARITVGALLTALGLAGTLALGPPVPVTAQPADQASEAHETMDAMMDAMHGPGTAERMHQLPGAEEMMEQCATMLEAMGGGMMDGIMGGGTMRGMMGG